MKTDPLKEVRLRKRIEQAQKDQLSCRFEAARAVYEDILVQEPGHAPTLHAMGVLSLQEGLIEEAEQWLLKALEVAPEDALNWNDLGEARRHAGRMMDAAVAYRRALELQPGLVEALNNLGVALAGLGEVEGAKRCFLEAIQADPDYAYPYNNLGVVLESTGSVDEALLYYEKAVKRNPEYVDAKENYASLISRHPEKLLESMSRMLEEAKRFGELTPPGPA